MYSVVRSLQHQHQHQQQHNTTNHNSHIIPSCVYISTGVYLLTYYLRDTETHTHNKQQQRRRRQHSHSQRFFPFFLSGRRRKRKKERKKKEGKTTHLSLSVSRFLTCSVFMCCNWSVVCDVIISLYRSSSKKQKKFFSALSFFRLSHYHACNR